MNRIDKEETRMPETILFALIYSKYRRYNIKPLFQRKEIYYVLAIEVIYICLQITLFAGNYNAIKYAGTLKSIYLCTYLGLILKHQLYKEAIIGSGFILLGGMCNNLAMAANGGKMPVFPSLSYLTSYAKPEAFAIAHQVANDFHILGDENTKLKILTDVVDIGYSILSVGDLLIRVFVVLIIYGAIKKTNQLDKHIITCT